VAILPEVQAEEALHVAEAVRTTVAAHTFQVGGGIHLTCSLGLASSPMHAEGREDLLRAAEQAMDAAKRFGRNQVRVAYDPAVLALFAASHPEGGREEAALMGGAEALVALVEARDHLTGQHSHHVAALARELALILEWPASEAQMLALAGYLHEIGKITVPDAILQKPGPLTEQEWDVMRTHPVVGAEVVSHIPALRPLAPVIRAHHERWDGQGYPDQLAGEAIPLGARILTAVDAYLTMIMDRPYRRAYTPAVAVAELRRCAGSQFDPQVVDVLLRLLGEPEEEVQRDRAPCTSSPQLTPCQIAMLRDYISDRLAQHISLSELATSVGLSVSYFTRLFKQSFGLAPHRYLITCRVERAKSLLLQGDLTLAEVAHAVGFADQSHLNRHFKRLMGISPGMLGK
jgi:HD-GYP domain-containing protein (c-di-GMP phosphodiesterase class II)